MQQTLAHEHHNPDLLAFIPTDINNLMEVGCSAGALAREYKKINSSSRYIGIEIVPEYVQLAKRYCDKVIELDIEAADIKFLHNAFSPECWIFGDSLEHLQNPWFLLSKIRQVLPQNGSIVACIPNAQHWSIQARLSCGAFRYEDAGLLDKTHLRWFTRVTIMEMFAEAGFKVVNGMPRIFDEPDRDKFLPSIRAMASNMGADPDMAVNDALPLQYVVKAIPVGGVTIPMKRVGMLSMIASLFRNEVPRFK